VAMPPPIPNATAVETPAFTLLARRSAAGANRVRSAINRVAVCRRRARAAENVVEDPERAPVSAGDKVAALDLHVIDRTIGRPPRKRASACRHRG